jgi:protease-4
VDFEQDKHLAEPLVVQPPKKRSVWRTFWAVFTVLSVLANIGFFLILVGFIAILATGQRGLFTEEVIQDGPRTNKIVVINLRGVIDNEQARDFYKQFKSARKDKNVKGIIVRVNSPGGMVSACDRIYNEIQKYRQQTEKPVIAFMQGIAASGGYYTSVGCEKIIAEPTTITGSLGVIMGYFVLQELLEEKLGIQPVIVKSGEKKDWPSSFRPPTEEQLEYLEGKLINPAYERFVQLIADSRPSLTLDQVKKLADGSIYSAAEALDVQLIDHLGYLDEAIELVKSLANIEKAQVVEYIRPFSLTNLLSSGSKNLLKIDTAKLYELTTPQVLYLWRDH